MAIFPYKGVTGTKSAGRGSAAACQTRPIARSWCWWCAYGPAPARWRMAANLQAVNRRRAADAARGRAPGQLPDDWAAPVDEDEVVRVPELL